MTYFYIEFNFAKIHKKNEKTKKKNYYDIILWFLIIYDD